MALRDLERLHLSGIIANEMGVHMKVTSGPAIEKPGEMAAILNNLQEGDILFVDEIHRLNRQVEEVLYPAMEDFAIDIMIGKGASARSIRLDLPKFTLVGATTRAGLLSAPLRDRFGVMHHLEFYNQRGTADDHYPFCPGAGSRDRCQGSGGDGQALQRNAQTCQSSVEKGQGFCTGKI